MSKIGGAVALLLTFPMIASAQSMPDLVIGWLGYSDGTINQALSVRNNGLRQIRSVKIGCRFFRDEKPLKASRSVKIKNISPNAVGYNSISIKSKISPDQADCHIVSVKYSEPQWVGDVM
jgi:hypothetical protein